MSKRKISIVVGLIVMALAVVLGYTCLKGYYGSRKIMVIRDASRVEPGLGLKALHEQGYTGKGLNVAVIDGSLLEGHETV